MRIWIQAVLRVFRDLKLTNFSRRQAWRFCLYFFREIIQLTLRPNYLVISCLCWTILDNMDPDFIYGSIATKIKGTWMEKTLVGSFLTGFVCAAARPAEPGALRAPRQLKRRFLHHPPHLSQGSSTFHLPVFRIHDMPLINGSGSGSCYFFYYFCLTIEGSGSGVMLLTIGSRTGSRTLPYAKNTTKLLQK